MSSTNHPPEVVDTKEMEALVDKYTKDFPVHHATASSRLPGDVLLLTGSTGHFGSAILEQLVLRNHVRKIYAFNRPDKRGKTIRQRHLDAFIDHGQDVTLLDSPKISWVMGDTSQSDLGITKEVYSEMRDSVTHVIHNAWKVHFNATLPTYEPLIRGLRNLVDLALLSPHKSPPRVLFTSSRGMFMGMKLPGAVPEAPSEIHKIRVSSGYIASKHVSEHILERASQRTPLRPIIVRVCQLTGFENGSWGVHEWVPQIILAADVVGCLPNNTTVAAWMPTVPAAIAVIQMLSSPYHYLHLAHPRPIPYSTLIRYAADIYNVPVIPYAEWLSKLEAQLPDANVDAKVAMKERPFLALLPVFRRFDENTFPDSMDVETRRAEEVAEALSEDHLPLLGREDVRRWIEYWKKTLRARSRAKL